MILGPRVMYQLASYACSGPSLPGTNMHMLFPFKSVCASFVDLRPFGVISYSITSSRTMLTKSSKPSSVPVNSRSFFMTTHIREPMHLSMSSSGKIWEAIQGAKLLGAKDEAIYKVIGPEESHPLLWGNQDNRTTSLLFLSAMSYTQHNMRYLKCLKCRRIVKTE